MKNVSELIIIFMAVADHLSNKKTDKPTTLSLIFASGKEGPALQMDNGDWGHRVRGPKNPSCLKYILTVAA